MVDEQQAWRDWKRVEACILFGLNRWLFTIVAIWAAYEYLKPISGFLAAGAVVIVLVVQWSFAKRDDRKRNPNAGGRLVK